MANFPEKDSIFRSARCSVTPIEPTQIRGRYSMKLMNFKPVSHGVDPSELRQRLGEQAFLLAEQIRRTGRQRQLRDVTLVWPIDQQAVSVIDLACESLSQGEISPATMELNELLDQIAMDFNTAYRLGPALRQLAYRVLPLEG